MTHETFFPQGDKKDSAYNVGLQLFRGEWKATILYWVPAIWCLLYYLPILLISQIFTECYSKHFIYAMSNNPHFHPYHKFVLIP